MKPSPTLLIGWDAADWKIITPLLDAGHLPALSRFINRGVMGNISTLRPALSPILWNSISTGKRPDKHGILGFIEPSPDGAGVRPVSSTSRKTKALWNILSQSNRKSHVVGWYASHPAEPISGICVSNQFAEPTDLNSPAPWPIPPASVHPPELRDAIANLRVHPREIVASDLAPLIPKLHEIDTASDPRPFILARLMAKAASIHAVTTAIMQNEPWDFLAAYYETIDMVGHHFMPYHPPRLSPISERDFDLYQHVITGIYRWHDMMLARLVDLAGPDATIILVSDHGFHSDHLRPLSAIANAAEEAVAWHRQHGIFAMAGPNIRPDERIYGATLLDVAPTILTIQNLPVGSDMDGKTLAQSFITPLPINRIPSWDDVPGDAGLHPPDLRVDPLDASQAIQQLVELGYMPAPSSDQREAADTARREWQYNLAASQYDAGRPDKALPTIESLYASNPTNHRFAILLAQCYSNLGRVADCRRLIESLNSTGITTPETDLWLGWALLLSNDRPAALQHLRRAEQSTPDSPAIHTMIGRVYLHDRQFPHAHRAFTRALEIDPHSESAHDGLAAALLALDRNEEAASHALRAVGLLHHFPTAHFRLGIALVRLEQYDRAAQSMEIAISMRPNMLDAHRYLAALYIRLNHPEKALLHRQKARELWSAREQSANPSQ
ncbi:MAG TPA: alkaline phosphatase family protein [Tepidisphaeraceae bacterium]|jgi:predicted AlkP superfamily phosphohydrolase/phosphomutase/tetratricopeptide (TPR) repeat protein|nr:alkaline phosphatase family protein [Tepidisphaeraceae bacterium]